MPAKMLFCLLCLLVALSFGTERTCLASATLTVVPAGDGVFVLRGATVQQAGGMDITVTYDVATLGNPRVEPGDLIAGALTAVNAGNAGAVRIGIIRTTPIQGNGIIATLRFDRKVGASGAIQAPTATLNTLVKIQGEEPVTSPGSSEQPAQEERNDGKTVTSLTRTLESVAPPATEPRKLTGVVTFLAGSGVVGEETPAEETIADKAATEPQAEAAVEPQSDKAAPPEQEILVLESVLDHFQKHAGERTPHALTTLFEQSGVGGFTQTTFPLLADGKSVLEVIFVAAAEDTDVANMTATGARLLSRKQDPDDPLTWIVQLQPEKGVSSASLSIPLKTFTIVFPLTVAPRLNIDLDRSGIVTPADFTLFIKKRSVFDLNGDGKRDYLDDYLFTANYLVALQREGQSTGKAGSTYKGKTPAAEKPR